TAIEANYSPQNANGVFTASVDLGAAIEDLRFNVILSDKQSPQVMINFGIAEGGAKLFVRAIYYPSYQSLQQYAGNTVISDVSISWMPYASGSGDDWQPTLVSSSVNKTTGKADFSIKVMRKKTVTDVVMAGG